MELHHLTEYLSTKLRVYFLTSPKRPTENELSGFSRLWHDGCGETIIEAQHVDLNHSPEV
jgi:hypothetical protein